MNIREEMINAKIEGKLQETTIKKLANCIKNWKDFTEFCDMVEEFEKNSKVKSELLKNLLLAAPLTLPVGYGISKGVGALKLRSAHKGVLKELKADPVFTDNNKVEKIYNMITQFAPRVSSNKVFAKNVMEQLYNAPIVTAPMVKEIVDVEKGLAQAGAGTPGVADILQSMRTSQQALQPLAGEGKSVQKHEVKMVP
jgi:hypothetical protein